MSIKMAEAVIISQTEYDEYEDMRLALKEIISSLIGGGGPLNDNKLQFNHEQRMYLIKFILETAENALVEN